MRFHFGVSFRLRNLKKFIFPFILGLLSYFGFSYFNLLSVYAYGNFDTYYDLEVEEQDFSSISIGDFTMQDLLNFGLEETSDYYINTSYFKNSFSSGFSYGVEVSLFPKSYINREVSIYNNKGSSSSSARTQIITSYDYTNTQFYKFYFDSNNSAENLDNIYTALNDCLYSMNCSSEYISTQYILPTYSVGVNINNDNSYSVDVFNDFNSQGGYYYINQLPVVNRQGEYNSSWFFVKTIKVNNNIVEFDDNLPTYCDLYNCGSNPDESFDLFLDKLPFIYSNTNDLSTYNSTISFSPTINVEDYVNNLYTYKFYYGRVNHGTYYTYEQLNCTSSSISNTDDLSVSINTTNVNCSNDLTKYDKYFITYNFKYENDNLSKSIYGFLTTINNGLILHNTKINYYLLDDFDNLPRGFSLMLSNNDTLNNLDSYFYSSNPYIAFDDIPKNISNTTKTTNGIFYKDIPIPKKRSYGFTTNTNLLVYDDLSYSTDESTTLYIYLNPQTLLSFVDTSNNQNNYTYYDSNNNITTSSINLIYDTLDNNQYDLSYYFNIVNDTLNSFNNKLVDFHNFNDELFNQIPIEFQSLIILIIILCLSYALFKVVRS